MIHAQIKEAIAGLDRHGRELLSGTAASLTARLFGAGTQFVFILMLGRFLGAEGLGIYALALSVCMVASVVGRAGMDFSILRFVAVHQAEALQPRLKQGWNSMLGYTFISSLAVTALLFALAGYVAEDVFSEPNLTVPLRWMLLSVVPFSLLNFLAESLRALQRVGMASLVQAGLLPVSCILFFWLLFNAGFGLQGAVLAYLVSALLVMGIAYALWRRAMPQLSGVQAKGGPPRREILDVSIPMAWVSIAAVLMGFADTMILGLFRPATEVGIYGAALRMSLLPNLFLVAVNSMIAPKFAALYQQGDREAMERMGKFGTKLMLLLVLPAVLIFILMPATVLQVFGEEFRSGAAALVILSIGRLINSATGSSGVLLLMTGHERQMRRINIVSLLFSVIIGLVLVPGYGIIGAAIANIGGLVMLNVLALAMTMRRVRVSIVPWISIAGRVSQ